MKSASLKAWISAAATLQDKELLRRIAELDGHAGESAALRRLIREEGRRRGLLLDPTTASEAAPRVGSS